MFNLSKKYKELSSQIESLKNTITYISYNFFKNNQVKECDNCHGYFNPHYLKQGTKEIKERTIHKDFYNYNEDYVYIPYYCQKCFDERHTTGESFNQQKVTLN